MPPPPFRTIMEALEGLTVPELKARAALIPDSRAWTRKAEIINEIRPYMQGERLRAVWSSLDSLQQAAISEVVHSDNQLLDTNQFHAKYGEPPGFGSTANSWAPKPKLLDLFFFGYVMPLDLKGALAKFVPPPEPLKVESMGDGDPVEVVRENRVYDRNTGKHIVETEQIPLTLRNTELAAQDDIVALLHLVASGKVRVSDKTLQPSAATMKIVSASLTDSDWYSESAPDDEEHEEDEAPGPIKAFAWPLLLQAAELAHISSGRLELTRTGHAALTARPADTVKSVWKKWLSNSKFDELRRINVIKGQTGHGKSSLTAVSKRRAAVAGALMNCPVGQWITVDEFWRLVRVNHPFAVTRNEWTLYVSSPQYGSFGDSGSWSLLEGRFSLCMLFEYAATLGLVDIAYTHPSGAASDYSGMWGTDDLYFFSRYDGLEYFRINSLGAFCLGSAAPYTPPIRQARRTLRVLPNNDIVVVEPPLAAADAILLDRFAAATSEGVWRIGQSTMLSALEAGHSLDPLRALLHDQTVGDVPETVRRLLDETEERGRKLRDCGAARLFECSDTHVRTLIAHDPSTRKLCYLAGDKHIAVPGEYEKAFLRAVRVLGYVPCR